MTAGITLVIGVFFASAGMILMRYGGKDLDFFKGLFHVINNGYLWLLGLFLGWLAGLSFAFVTTRMEISTAISFYVPLTYLLTSCAGMILLNEPISFQRVIGNACIIVGLCILLY